MTKQARGCSFFISQIVYNVDITKSLVSVFCRGLQMPFGFNVESVSIRKVEIEASVLLAKEVGTLLQGPRST